MKKFMLLAGILVSSQAIKAVDIASMLPTYDDLKECLARPVLEGIITGATVETGLIITDKVSTDIIDIPKQASYPLIVVFASKNLPNNEKSRCNKSLNFLLQFISASVAVGLTDKGAKKAGLK